MTTTTSIDGEAVDVIVTRLRGLVTPAMLAELEKPDSSPLDADGPGFDAARWLDDVITDRRQALAELVRNLRSVFEELADTLASVRNEISRTDSSAAATLARSGAKDPE